MTGLPTLIRPMLVSLRHELPADEESYGWELKWDGLRAIAYVSGEEVRLVSRNDKDMAPSYPELGVLAERVSTPVILDGEIVALRGGRPDFGLLQSRMHVQHPDAALLRRAPVQYYVFDLLHQGQDPLLGLPYTDRRARLEELGLDAIPVRTPPWHRGGADKVLAESIAKGLEGVVGKPWRGPTTRTSAGTGSRSRTSSSRKSSSADGSRAKAVARTRSARCWSASTTATSCDTPDMSVPASPRTCSTDLMGQLGSLGREESPFGTKVPAQYARGARWVEPRLVGEVTFAEWTTDGILRQPSWRGLRIDKEPGEVHREDPL